MQVALARLQYSIVESLLEVDPGIVLHGDTAIWRCYSGNRFSEDVDICATDAQVDKPGKLITWSLSKRNIKMDYPLRTSRAVNVLSNDARSKFEAMEFPGGLKPVRMEFRKSDGSKMVVNTLSVGDFIKEKIPTYEKRKYVRDLYDIYHLTRVGGLSTKSKRMLSRFLSQLGGQPTKRNSGTYYACALHRTSKQW